MGATSRPSATARRCRRPPICCTGRQPVGGSTRTSVIGISLENRRVHAGRSGGTGPAAHPNARANGGAPDFAWLAQRRLPTASSKPTTTCHRRASGTNARSAPRPRSCRRPSAEAARGWLRALPGSSSAAAFRRQRDCDLDALRAGAAPPRCARGGQPANKSSARQACRSKIRTLRKQRPSSPASSILRRLTLHRTRSYPGAAPRERYWSPDGRHTLMFCLGRADASQQVISRLQIAPRWPPSRGSPDLPAREMAERGGRGAASRHGCYGHTMRGGGTAIGGSGVAACCR